MGPSNTHTPSFSTTMKGFTTIAIASLVSAQSLSDIPTCAERCLTSLRNTGCSTTDVACICASSAFNVDFKNCVTGACDSADQQTILNIAQSVCGGSAATTTSAMTSGMTSGMTSSHSVLPTSVITGNGTATRTGHETSGHATMTMSTMTMYTGAANLVSAPAGSVVAMVLAFFAL